MFFITLYAHPAFGVPLIVASFSDLDVACSNARKLHELCNCSHSIKVIDSHPVFFDEDRTPVKLELFLE